MDLVPDGLLLTLLFLFNLNETIIGQSCLSSIATLQTVEECPKTQLEWNEKSAKKRCDMLAGTGKCASYHYHCLLNQWRNETVEVCAPTWYMSGFCGMYNTDEARVIDNFNIDCNSSKLEKKDRCPSRYISTDAYKYQVCYRKRNKIHNNTAFEKLNQKEENGLNLSIIFIILFAATLITAITLAVLLILVKNGKLWENKKEQGENTPVNESFPETVPLLDDDKTKDNEFKNDLEEDESRAMTNNPTDYSDSIHNNVMQTRNGKREVNKAEANQVNQQKGECMILHEASMTSVKSVTQVTQVIGHYDPNIRYTVDAREKDERENIGNNEVYEEGYEDNHNAHLEKGNKKLFEEENELEQPQVGGSEEETGKDKFEHKENSDWPKEWNGDNQMEENDANKISDKEHEKVNGISTHEDETSLTPEAKKEDSENGSPENEDTEKISFKRRKDFWEKETTAPL